MQIEMAKSCSGARARYFTSAPGERRNTADEIEDPDDFYDPCTDYVEDGASEGELLPNYMQPCWTLCNASCFPCHASLIAVRAPL